MPPPHSGVALIEKIFSILTDWGIENKLFSVTLDNASANDAFVSQFRDQLNVKKSLLCSGDFFHLRCCAHVLNFILQDGLRNIDRSVQKVRESVKYVKGSQGRKQKFLDCVNFLSMNAKRGLRQDVPTRWNSTFLMLQSALFYRRAFCHLELSDSNYKSCPSPIEWEKIEKISKFLDDFYDITCAFSGSKYPTASLYFPRIFMAYLSLKEKMDSNDEYLKEMAVNMMTKFEKYWADFNTTLAITVILDPRYTIQFVDWGYKKLYGLHSSQFRNVKDSLFSLFEEYSSRAPSRLNGNGSNGQELIDDSRYVFKEFDTFESEEFGGARKKSQLEQYLDEKKVERTANIDVLAFWKANQFYYPELSHMPRDVLSIPITIVASESSFSIGGQVLDQYRSSLKPQTVEALICTRD
ncbi:zinc finger BED domain-containing protein RICESLEEPER 2-like [Mercurialis annua]|uniref:zinc finger BED domain-containing protein RICESLEEPER 2-like n=1 Tax=Mercurialis annua TaxID=3986 RepID=UPI00215F9708|nr:zinc finger BED domain-containing protein RICESLEEPER 2-like [Mercurialis annua]